MARTQSTRLTWRRVAALAAITIAFVIVAWLWPDTGRGSVNGQSVPASTALPAAELADVENTQASTVEPSPAGTVAVLDDRRIDCTSTDATGQVLQVLEQEMAGQIALLETHDVAQWVRNDQPEIEASNDANGNGIKTLGSHSEYSDAILKSNAQHGDAISAAVYGARLLHRLQQTARKDGDHAQREQQLAESEQYLLKAFQGGVRGNFRFLEQLLQQRAKDFHHDAAYGKRSDTEVKQAEVEQQAWLHVQMRHGSFNERIYAYYALQQQRWFEAFTGERQQQGRARANVLERQLNRMAPLRSQAEQAAEQAAYAFFDTFVEVMPRLERLRCRDGHLIKASLRHEAVEQLAARFR